MSDIALRLAPRSVPITYEIRHRFYCKRCMEGCPQELDLDEWVRVAIGLTEHGLQVWCLRHRENIIHIDHLGQRLPANVATRVR